MSNRNLDTAIKMATHYHAGQTDQGGQPYILHPLRVMLSVKRLDEQIVAVMHDLVEDTDVTLDVIEDTFGKEIREAVDSVTRREGESYTDFIKRSYMNPVGRVVKIADIKDNLDINRPGSVKFLSGGISKRYYEALLFLEGK